jgi:hypothetical protein
MKTRFVCFVLAFFLLAASALAGPWVIDSFDNSPDPGEADSYIAAESSSGLKPVQPGQVSAQSGRLYVRQKFEDPFGGNDDEATYQLFQGRATEATKSLGKISVDGIPYNTLLKMKIFGSKNSTGDDDFENVYFDGKDIFIESDKPVYMNLNGRMEEFRPISSKEFQISVTSTPQGATVTVGGSEKGKTPVTFAVPSQKTITAVITMDGYYATIRPITPSDKAVQEGVSLVKKLPLENPATTYRTKLQAASSGKDASAVKSLKADIQKTLNNFTADTKKNVDAIMSKFPENPPKASNESDSDFSARKTTWTNTQARERDALNKKAQEHFNELKDLLSEVDAAGGDMDFALKYEYVPNSAITFSNLGVKDFTIDVELDNPHITFEYNRAKLAYGSLSRSELEDDQESVHGVIKVWDTPNENKRYTSIYDIAFFHDETPLKVLTKGTFKLPEATPTSRNTERDLNSRITKFPKKAAWDRKDEEATLAALRAGEVTRSKSSKPAPKVVQKEEEDAYYDEDDEEDEYEESSKYQEERDYSRRGASGASAADIFGNTDEYLFWTGMVFLAGAIGTGVVGFLQHNEWVKADDAMKVAKEGFDKVMGDIARACEDAEGVNWGCVEEAKRVALDPEFNQGNKELLYRVNEYIELNKKAKDGYNKGRIIFFSAAAVSLAISITLFVW